MSFKITRIWVYVGLDPATNEEGVPAVRVNDVLMPLIAADEERLEFMRPIAQGIANQTGQPLELREYTEYVVNETVVPGA